MQPSALSDDCYAAVVLDLMRRSIQTGAATRLFVTGTSMLPLLRPGDVVWLESIDPARLRRGDLVVAWQHGTLLIHRLVAVGADGWQTKGDNNLAADPPMAAEAIQGRIVTVERGSALISMRQRRWLLANRLLGYMCWLERRFDQFRRSGWLPFRGLAYVQSAGFRLLIRSVVIVALR